MDLAKELQLVAIVRWTRIIASSAGTCANFLMCTRGSSGLTSTLSACLVSWYEFAAPGIISHVGAISTHRGNHVDFTIVKGILHLSLQPFPNTVVSSYPP